MSECELYEYSDKINSANSTKRHMWHEELGSGSYSIDHDIVSKRWQSNVCVSVGGDGKVTTSGQPPTMIQPIQVSFLQIVLGI
jgi:hypothetical protein